MKTFNRCNKVIRGILFVGAVAGFCQAVDGARADKEKERLPVIIKPELFDFDAEPGKEVKIGDGLMGSVQMIDGTKVRVVEHQPMAVPPGEKQRFEFLSRPDGRLWYAKDPKLVSSPKDDQVKKEESGGKYGAATNRRTFELTGAIRPVTLEFEYKRSRDKHPSLVYKVTINR